MSSFRRAIKHTMWCTLVSACAGPADLNPDLIEVDAAGLAESSEPLMAASHTLWPSTGLNTNIPICFTPEAWNNTVVKQAVMDATSLWSQSTNGLLQFTGKTVCDSGVQIRMTELDDASGSVPDLGRAARLLNLDRDYVRDPTWAKHVVLHELGHVLGLTHEAYHPDSTCGEEQGTRGNIWFEYDPESIMNYCATNLSLTWGDIVGIRRLYGGIGTTVAPGTFHWIATSSKAFLGTTNRAGVSGATLYPSVTSGHNELRFVFTNISRPGQPIRYGDLIAIRDKFGFLSVNSVVGRDGTVSYSLAHRSTSFNWRAVPFGGATGDVGTNAPVGFSMGATSNVALVQAVNLRTGAVNVTLTSKLPSENPLTPTGQTIYSWRILGPAEP